MSAHTSKCPAKASATGSDGDSGEPRILEFSFGRYYGTVHPQNPSLRHGQGKLSYNSGNMYAGAWCDGAPHGLGEKHYSNGDVFVGLWAQGKREGRGSYLFNEGHIFEGIYANDQPEGYGILTTVEGDRYSGWWRAGAKHGKGVEILHEGQMFIGTWSNGVKEGPGKVVLPGTKSAIYGMWERDHFKREMTPEEKAAWKAQRQQEDDDDRAALGDAYSPPSRLPGEGAEDWDSEYERNSSDEDRERELQGQTDGQEVMIARPPQQDLAALFSAASGNPSRAQAAGLDTIISMESRLEALELALQNAMQGS